MSVLNGLEVARDKMTLLREIGQGEFGVVMEASAVGLPHSNIPVQTVAVKIAKAASHAARLAFTQEAVSPM